MTTAAANEYGLNDKPPLLTTLFLGFQHAVMLTAMFVFPIIIISLAHGSLLGELHMIQACMFIMGIGTILLAMNNRFFGSGYLASPINDPAFFPVSLVAAKIGGLPLLYTVNYLQSILQIVFAEALVRFRKYFPMEVTGLVILMIGISVITSGITNALGGVEQVQNVRWNNTAMLLSFSTLIVMIGVTVWGKKLAKYGLLFGIVWGCLIAIPLHKFSIPDHTLSQLHLFSFPTPVFFQVQMIHWDLVLPILVAVIAVSLKAMGGFITLQKINDPTWVKPDMINIRKGLLTTGFCSLFSTALGGMPLGNSSINVGLEITTRCTSRRIAWALGATMIILSFFPLVSEVFVLLPKPVMGAMIIFVISSLIITGIQIMLIPLMNSRRLFVIGIPIIIGLTFEFMPQLQNNMPPGLQMLVASPLTSATILAIVLNFFAVLGSVQKVELNIDFNSDFAIDVNKAMMQTETSGNNAPNTINQVIKVLLDNLAIVKKMASNDKMAIVLISYDDYTVKGIINYDGNKKYVFTTDI